MKLRVAKNIDSYFKACKDYLDALSPEDAVPVLVLDDSMWIEPARRSGIRLIEMPADPEQKNFKTMNKFEAIKQFYSSHRNKEASNSDFVIIILDPSDFQYLLPAVFYALSKKRPLHVLHNWQELKNWVSDTRREISSVSVFFMQTSIKEDANCVIQDLLLLSAERPGFKIGFFTGRDLSSLSWLVAKNMDDDPGDNGKALLFLDAKKSALGSQIPDLTVFGEAECGEQKYLKKVLDTLGREPPYRLILIENHGRSDHVGIGLGAVCGATTSHITHVTSGNTDCDWAPQCGFGRSCFKKGVVFQGNTLNVKTLFIHSCASAHLGDSIYESRFLLSLAVIDSSAAAFVGTLKAKLNGGWEASLFTQMLRTGKEIGHVTRLLNRFEILLNGNFPSFLLIGDPLARPYTNTVEQNQPLLNYDGDGIAIDTHGAPFVQISGRSANSVFNSEVELKSHYPQKRNLHAILDGENEDFDLYLWSFPSSLPDDLRLKIDTTNAVTMSQFYCRLNHELDHAKTGRRLSLVPPVIDSQEKYLKTLLLNLCSLDRTMKFHPASRSKKLVVAQNIREVVMNVDKKIAHAILGITGNPWPFIKYFEETFSARHSIRSDELCFCGRPTYVSDMRNSIAPNVCYNVFTCARCGSVKYRCGSDIKLDWNGRDTSTVGSTMNHRFVFRNEGNQARSGYFGLFFSKSYEAKVSFEPRLFRFNLDPGESRDFSIDMLLKQIVPHVYVVQAFLVSQMAIEYYRRTIFVTE